MKENEDKGREIKGRIAEQELQKIYRKALGGKPGGDLGCPSSDAILKSFLPETDEAEKLRVADHVFQCRACLEKFEALQAMFREMKKAASEMDGISASPLNWQEIRRKAAEKALELEKTRRRGRNGGIRERISAAISSWAPRRLWAPAGAVMILVVGVILIFLLRDKAADIMRGREDHGIKLIEPRGKISGPPVFRWEPHPDARGYAVKLVTEDLSEIWISDRITATEVTLPLQVFSGLAPHRKYYWKLVVFLDDQRLLESGFLEFRLKE